MDNDFKVAWCPFCNQGWVEIVKDSGNDDLVLICAECYTTWKEPGNITLDNSIRYEFLGMAETPSLNEIKKIGWENFLLGSG